MMQSDAVVAIFATTATEKSSNCIREVMEKLYSILQSKKSDYLYFALEESTMDKNFFNSPFGRRTEKGKSITRELLTLATEKYLKQGGKITFNRR